MIGDCAIIRYIGRNEKIVDCAAGVIGDCAGVLKGGQFGECVFVVNSTRPASKDITRPCHKECSNVRQRAGTASFRNQGLIVGMVKD